MIISSSDNHVMVSWGNAGTQQFRGGDRKRRVLDWLTRSAYLSRKARKNTGDSLDATLGRLSLRTPRFGPAHCRVPSLRLQSRPVAEHHYQLESLPHPVRVRQASVRDARTIARSYAAVSITERNVATKLAPGHPGNFFNSGGIFKPFSENQIKRMIRSPLYEVIVLEILRPKGKPELVGSYSCRNNAFLFQSLRLNSKFIDRDFDQVQEFLSVIGLNEIQPNNPTWQAELKRALRECRHVAGAVDLIVHPGAQRKGLMSVLKYDMMRRMNNRGQTYMLTEIYTISQARFVRENEVSSQHVFLPNSRSLILNRKTGAVFAGTLPRPLQCIGNWEIEVIAEVLLAKTDQAFEHLMPLEKD